MQNSQEINWFVILAPSLIVGLFAVIVQILLAYWLSKVSENYKKDLSKEIEGYKAELNKELENYKFQLQSDFQTKFYEFQTRFSLFQQRKAEAIKCVYTAFVEIELQLNEINNFTNWLAALDGNFKNHTVQQKALGIKDKSIEKLNELEVVCNSNKIYFDLDISKEIDETKSLFSKLIQSNIQDINTRNGLDNGFVEITFLNGDAGLRSRLLEEKIRTNEIIEGKLINIKEKLDGQFRQLLSAENPNNQLVKKQ